MSKKTVCRFCGDASSQVLFQKRFQKSGGGLAQSRRAYAISGSSLQYAPDRPFKTESILLDVEVNPREKTLRGKTVQRLRVVSPDQNTIKLDQVGLKINEVYVGSESTPATKVSFVVEGKTLQIALKNTAKVGSLLELVIHYAVQTPQRGIYFTGPDAENPSKPYQVWTQGQDEDSRHWFPCLDYPNQKIRSEVVATVPPGFTAVSNGALISRENLPGNQGTRFHYQLSVPHVTYLVSLVVGEFSEWSDKGPRGLPIQYFVPQGREEDGKRAFSNTPRMIEAFEKLTGVPYPYEKYSQVAVQDFIFGGMENTSSTTQTELTLHDARAHLDFTSDPLVAHELAHQWFGDLVTCRDWSHGWLNEGFATFMERVWVECRSNMDEANYYSYLDLKEYLDEDQGQYRRPIVCNTYIDPIDLFDTHLYQKGGLVLNLVRSVLGDTLFWKSVQLYLTRHRGQNVETLDLIRAIEDATGRNLRRFFDEWVFSAGYPEFEVSYQWHDDKKMTEWVIEQKQTDGAPLLVKDGVTTPLFHLPVVLELTLEGGEKLSHKVEIGEARERIFLPAPSKPLMVRFDPSNGIPKLLKFPRSRELLLYQLKNDKDGMGRVEAAFELSKMADLEIVRALGQSASTDSFWGVQIEAAKALADIRMDASAEELIKALKATHPKARRGIVEALGSFREPRVTEALRKIAEKDESYFVEAEAILSWMISQITSAHFTPLQNPAQLDPMENFLLQQLEKQSYREVVRGAVYAALVSLPGISQGERPKAFKALIEGTQKGIPNDQRVAAVRALGRVLKTAKNPEKSQILELFSILADENNFRLRVQLVSSLSSSGVVETIPLLNQLEQNDPDSRVKRAAQRGVDYLGSSGGLPDSYTSLKAAYDRLEEDFRKFRSTVEEKLPPTPSVST